jgi:hypothetical protein
MKKKGKRKRKKREEDRKHNQNKIGARKITITMLLLSIIEQLISCEIYHMHRASHDLPSASF